MEKKTNKQQNIDRFTAFSAFEWKMYRKDKIYWRFLGKIEDRNGNIFIWIIIFTLKYINTVWLGFRGVKVRACCTEGKGKGKKCKKYVVRRSLKVELCILLFRFELQMQLNSSFCICVTSSSFQIAAPFVL